MKKSKKKHNRNGRSFSLKWNFTVEELQKIFCVVLRMQNKEKKKREKWRKDKKEIINYDSFTFFLSFLLPSFFASFHITSSSTLFELKNDVVCLFLLLRRLCRMKLCELLFLEVKKNTEYFKCTTSKFVCDYQFIISSSSSLFVCVLFIIIIY